MALRTASASGPVVGALYGSMAVSDSMRTSRLCSFTKSRMSFMIFLGFWFCTRRHDTFTAARGGTTVLIPGPV